MTNKGLKPGEQATPIQKIRSPGSIGESVNLANLPPVHDFDFRIDSAGAWYYRGSLIQRKALVKLFSTILRQEDDGSYWLKTPVEKAKVHVEDAPFTAVEFFVRGAGPNQIAGFVTNLEHEVELDSEHGLRLGEGSRPGEPRPYVLVRPGLEALVTRSAYYDMAEAAQERDMEGQATFGIWSHGLFFVLHA